MILESYFSGYNYLEKIKSDLWCSFLFFHTPISQAYV